VPPRARRPRIPAAYGVASDTSGLLAWETVSSALLAASRYWLATVSRDGAPHVVQQSALWLDDALYFGGDAATLWARNLARRPRAAISVESESLSVMVNGTAERPRTLEGALIARLAADSKRKYNFAPTPADYERSLASGHVWIVRPSSVLAWNFAHMDTSATAFDFD
jgi:nitroimidazol reductase NimA-like FMN-containing flavoprotein (pyridoxamine 5'-phosphate oxidase superfamily)